jgi:hypothetical protein
MLGSNILDVLIGLSLVFLLLSLVTMGIGEALAGFRRTRGRYLATGIRELLGSGPLLGAFYEHPQIYPLFEGTTKPRAEKHPSYIPSSNFAAALLDMAARGLDHNSALQSGPEATPVTAEMVRRNVTGLKEPRVQRLILSALESSKGDIDAAQLAIQKWFDSAMDRVSGRYRRHTSFVVFWIGIAISVLINVDTIDVGTSLYRSPALREAAVAMAGRIVDTVGTAPRAPDSAAQPGQVAPVKTSHVEPRGAIDTLFNLSLPIGWSSVYQQADQKKQSRWGAVGRRAAHSLFGWLITAFAITLGAPFWFDVLNRLIIVRSTVKPREKSPEEAPIDRQPKDSSNGSKPAVTVAVAPTTSPAPPPAPATTPATRNGAPEEGHEWAIGDPQGGIL